MKSARQTLTHFLITCGLILFCTMSVRAQENTSEFPDQVGGESQPLAFKPHWNLVGMASGQVGWRKTDAPPVGVNPGATFSRGSYLDGRTALFARGQLTNSYSLTTSYDSDRKYEERVFRFLTPARVYPIYGDASSIFYEAPSTSRLFLRLEGKGNYLHYGDFSTGLSQPEMSAYNRSFTGISSGWNEGGLGLKLFGASTEQAIQVDELPGEGVSGYYYLTATRRGAAVVDGSERVVLQTRDIFHPEHVLEEKLQFRFSDYEIDYEAGTLLFKRPVPSHTTEEHPIFIVVTYEATRALEERWVGGGRASYVDENLGAVGVTVAGEERATGNYWLTGLDGNWHLNDQIDLMGEVARTDQAREGWAWKAGARGKLGAKLDFDLYARDAGRNFDNPSSPTARAGVRKLRGKLNWALAEGVSLTGEAFRATDLKNEEERTSGRIASLYSWRTLTQKTAVEQIRFQRRGQGGNSTVLNGGLDWRATSRLSVGVDRDQVFGDKDEGYRPPMTMVRGSWKINEKLDLVAEHTFRGMSFLERSFTAAGIQSRFSENLKAYANYKLDGGINGRTNQAIIGLSHRYQPRQDLTLHGSFERLRSLGYHEGDFYAYSLAGEYLPKAPLKGSMRFEQREGKALDKIVASAALDFTLSRSLTFLGKHTYLNETRVTEGVGAARRKHHFLTGLAYRAVDLDMVNVLGKYELKHQYNALLQPARGQGAHIGSVEMILEPWSQIEWFGRYAFKVANLSSEGLENQTLTDLWMTSIRWEWRHSWDLLAEYRLLTQHSSDDYMHGAALESGFIVHRNTRLALGYNFSGYEDEDFSGSSYWAQGPYMKVQVKFSELDVAPLLNGLQSRWMAP